MSGSKYSVGFATVFMLVALRLVIGWHFFHEGVNHYTDPKWSSEGFLRSAVGPFAPRYQAVLPDYYGFEEVRAYGDVKAANKWFESFGEHLATYRQRFAKQYQFDPKQLEDAQKLTALRQLQLKNWIAGQTEEIEIYFYERDQLAKEEGSPAAEAVPFKKVRVGDKKKELTAKTRGWVAQLQAVENDHKTELDALRTPEQIARGPIASKRTTLQRVDKFMTYGILGVGACLIVGLFTRLACVLGVAFLLSVVMSQPFWVVGAGETFNQWVELVALLALATTNVGKWGGLDFFLSCMFGGCCGRKCETKRAIA